MKAGLRDRLPGKVFLRDVTLRDGLQSEDVRLETSDKVRLVEKILAAGVRELEVASFVSPKRVPAMADAEALWKALPRPCGVRYSALVLNGLGLERAVCAGVEEVGIFVSASEAHSRRNSGRSVSQALAEVRTLIREAKRAGIRVRAGVMNAFGCHLEKEPIRSEAVMALVRDLSSEGPAEIVLADTSGIGHPAQIAEMVEACRKITGGLRLSLHLHDASGWAFANLLAALEVGVDTFDAALAGLGGCPFLPGAAGNVSAERVARFCQALGIQTGLDASALDEASALLKGLLSAARARETL